MIHSILYGWGSLILFFSALPLQSQQIWDIAGDSVITYYQLEEVVVYGIRHAKSPSMISEIDGTEIRASRSITVADVLRSDPGLTVTSGTKAETETRIRGFDARDVLVLVDGRPINPGYYGKADLSMIPKDHIAKIKVVKGPASVAFGANSMGGVINIVTKNGFESTGTFLDTEFGSHRFRKIALNHGGSAGRFYYWISGYEQYADGFSLSGAFEETSLEDGGQRENSRFHKAGATAKLVFRPSSQTLYGLSLGYHWAEKECPWTVYAWDGPQYRKFPKWERYGLSMSGQWAVKQNVDLKSVVFADAYHDRFVSYTAPEMGRDQIAYDSLLENWTVGLSSDMKIRIATKDQLHLGFHFRRDLMNKRPDTDESWYSRYTLSGNIFAEYRLHPFHSTLLTGGLGLSFFDTQNRMDWTHKTTTLVSLNQKLPFQFDFHASFSNAIRFPTMHHLYSESSGNEALLPEEANKFEIGMARFIHLMPILNGSLEVVYFSNDLTHMIYRASRTFQYENIESATLKGWEIRTDMQFFSNVTMRLSYANVNTDQTSDELMEEIPEHQWGFRFLLDTGFGLELNYEYRYHGQRMTYYESVVLNRYHIHHVSLSQRIWRKIILTLRCSNLFDEYYEEELGYPAPGRQITVGFSWSR